MGRFLKIFGQKYLKFNLVGVIFTKKMKYRPPLLSTAMLLESYTETFITLLYMYSLKHFFLVSFPSLALYSFLVTIVICYKLDRFIHSDVIFVLFSHPGNMATFFPAVHSFFSFCTLLYIIVQPK